MENKTGGIKDGGRYTYDPSSSQFIKQNLSPETSRIVAQSWMPEKKEKKDFGAEFKNMSYNGSIISKKQDASFDIFKSINIPSTSTKSHAQKSIETIQRMQVGDVFNFFDIENVGTHGGDWYSPLEFGFRQAKVSRGKDGKLEFTKSEKALSLLVQPGESQVKEIEKIFNKLQNAHITGVNLNKDERRTINDLIMYGDEDPFQNGFFRKDGNRTTILKQNKDAKAMSGTLFTHEQIKAARRGLDNVVQYGTKPQDVAQALLSTLRTGKEMKLGGQNINTYDIPFMKDYIREQLIPNMGDNKTKAALRRLVLDIGKADTFDTLSIGTSLYSDFATKHSLVNQQLANYYSLTGEKAVATHMALQDTDLTIDVANKVFLGELDVEKVVNGEGRNRMNASWNGKSIKPGDRVFSMTGLPAYEKGAHDAVFKFEEGKGLVPAYQGAMNPVSKDTEYEVVKRFSGALKGSNGTQHGILLKNLETNLFHFIARDSQTDLQSVYHQVFKPVEEVADLADETSTNRSITRLERARRTYDKMFSANESGGGRWMLERMYGSLDALHEGRRKVKKGEIRKADLADYVKNHQNVVRQINGKSTPLSGSQYRDLLVMEPTLGKERNFWQNVMGQLDSNFPSQNGFIPLSQNIALNKIKNGLDDTIGKSTSTGTMPRGKGFLELSLPGDEKHRIDLTSDATAARNIRSYLTKGLDIKENLLRNGGVDIGIVKNRLTDIVTGAHRAGSSGLTARERDTLINSIGNLKQGDSPYLVIEGMARTLRAEYDHNPSYVNHNVEYEDVSKPRKALDRLYENPNVVNRLIDDGIITGKVAHKQRSYNIDISDPLFQKSMNTHNEALEGLAQMSGAKGARGVKTMKAQDVVKSMIESYAGQGLATSLIYDGSKSTYMLAVMEETIMKDVLKLQPNEILEHAKVASVPIPLLDENMNVKMPGATKAGYLKAMRMNGKDIFGTPLEQLAQGINMRANSTKELIRGGNVQEASARLRRQAREATEKFSHNNPYTDPREITKHDSKRSQVAQRAAKSKVDVSGWAEEWYQWYDHRYGFEKEMGVKNKYQQIKDRSREQYKPFFEMLGMKEQHAFQSTIQEFASKEKNMYISAHGVSGEQVLNGIYSTIEGSQNYQAFGHYNIMAREQMNKTRNYVPLEEKATRAKLLSNGFTPTQVERMIQNPTTTNQAEGLMSPVTLADGTTAQYKELSGLNVQAVELTDKEIQLRMDKFQEVNPSAYRALEERYGKNFRKNLTTFEGMSIVHEGLQDALTVTRQKNFTLERGFDLSDPIYNFLKNAEMNDVDTHGYRSVRTDNGGWKIEGNLMHDDLNLDNLGRDANGRITIGKATVAGVTRPQTEKAWGDGFFLNEYNPETRKITTQMLENADNGVKLLTDANHRITTSFFGEDIFSALGVGEAKLIVTASSLSKAMHGTEIEGNVKTAVDEANRLITNFYTAGGEVSKSGTFYTGKELRSIEARQALEAEGRLTQKEVVASYVDSIKNMTQRIFNIEDKNIAIKPEAVQGTNYTIGKLVIDGEHGRINGPSYSMGDNIQFMKESGETLDALANATGNTGYVAPINRTTKYFNTNLRRADIYKWQDQMGYAEGKSGLVRYTYKEVEANVNRANQILGRKDHTVGKFLTEQVKRRSLEQNKGTLMGVPEQTSAVVRSMLDFENAELQKQGLIQKDDIVIRTSGNVMTDLDPDGTQTAVMKNGHLEISQHALRDPQFNVASVSDMALGSTSKYDMTLANPSSLHLNVEGSDLTVGDMVKKNGGSFLLEMPNNAAHTFKNKYVRLMAPGTMTIGVGEEALEMAGELEKKGLSIWRNIKAYQDSPTMENKEAIESSVESYQKHLNYMVTGSHKGTLLDMNSAKMDMSGRFHIEGVNMHEKGLAEGEVLIGREQMQRMISGAEEDIVQALNPKRHEAILEKFNDDIISAGEMDKKDRKAAKQKAYANRQSSFANEALEIAETRGLYGFTNRYPTINKQTNLVLNYKVDDSIKTNTMYVGAGTAKIIKTDHDGDNGNAVFSHYKQQEGVTGYHGVEDIRAIDSEMRQIQQSSVPLFEQARTEMMKDEMDHYKKLEDIAGSSDISKVTVQDVMEHDAKKMSQLGELGLWTPKTGKLYELESNLARTGKSNIGVLDNLRQRIQTLSKPTYEALVKRGLMDQDTANEAMNVLEEFSSRISQDAISSKKISVGALVQDITKSWGASLTNDPKMYQQAAVEHFGADTIMKEVKNRMTNHYQAIELLKEGVVRPDAEGMKKISLANDVLGIFGSEGETMKRYGLDRHMDQLSELFYLSDSSFTENPYLKAMQSQGLSDAGVTTDMLAGNRNHAVPTPHGANIADNSPEYRGVYDKGAAAFEENVAERYRFKDRAMKDALQETITETPHLSKNTLTEMAGADKPLVRMAEAAQSKLASIGHGMGPGMIGGAIGFGAMWATSALMRSTPTPESMQETAQMAPPPPPPVQVSSGPTARVVDNENINISIKAKDAKGLSQEQIARMVHEEIAVQTSAQLNMNMNVNDNTQNINREWLQGAFANAMGKGIAY